MKNACWGNDWIPVCFCANCGYMPGAEVSFNIYKLKGLYFCGPCFETIEKTHAEYGVSLNKELVWEGDNSDLK